MVFFGFIEFVEFFGFVGFVEFFGFGIAIGIEIGIGSYSFDSDPDYI